MLIVKKKKEKKKSSYEINSKIENIVWVLIKVLNKSSHCI